MLTEAASALRRRAQRVRHDPRLTLLNPVWTLARAPYRRLLAIMAGRRGLSVSIAGRVIQLDAAFATQNWEEVEAASYRAFLNEVRSDSIVYDVGAHIGTYSLIAGSVRGARVVAYEPNAFTRAYLERHVAWNGMEASVLVRDACCSSRDGEATYYYRPESAEGMNGLIPVEGFSARPVRTATLDGEVAMLKLRPTLIKIDVEGAEWDVLRGAGATLERDRPILLVSLHADALRQRSTSVGEVLAWLSARGYTATIVDRDHELHVLAKPDAPG